MEFRFNINEILKTPIVEIGSNLVPPGFQGDRRQLWDTVTKVSEIVNTIGQASASAQGLTKPITTADRLRNAENQKLYLLIDRNSKTGKGCVTGMLKTGKKGLYVFDREGQHYQVQPNCVLDFYIHESRQRMGLGKHLFEHMLKSEEVDPVKLAIDRPSDKFLGFLKKHYNLDSVIRQMNNYVVYEGFFPKEEKLMSQQQLQSGNNNTETPNNRMTTTINLEKRGSNGLQQQNVTSPYGRYGAPRPPCSMGQIIHNQSTVAVPQEPSGCSINMKQSKERSPHTLRRGASRHSVEEIRKKYYAAPRLAFNSVAAVGNGLGHPMPSDSTNHSVLPSPTLQESNIQLATKEQMLEAALERQRQKELQYRNNRPPSLLQNLPSPSRTMTCSSQAVIQKNASQPVPMCNSILQQNVRVVEGTNVNIASSPSGLKYYQGLPITEEIQHRPLASAQPSNMRIGRPKPLEQYSSSPSTGSVTNANLTGQPNQGSMHNVQRTHPQQQQEYYVEQMMPNPQQQIAPNQKQDHQYVQQQMSNHQQYVQQPQFQQHVQELQQQQQQQCARPQVDGQNHGDGQNSPRVFSWQNQIYQSRDAPTNYPFVSNGNNPNKYYMSLEECEECERQKQQEILANQQISNSRPPEPIIPAVQDASFDAAEHRVKKSRSSELKVFPNDFQQGIYQQRQPQGIISPPGGQIPQQTYQLNSQNANSLPEYRPATLNDQQYKNLCQTHHQQYHNSTVQNPNMYQPLPTITEADSEQQVTSTTRPSLPQITDSNRPTQQSISKFNANLLCPERQEDVPINTERKPVQEISPRLNECALQQPASPRYNQNNVSSAVTSQNIGNFDVQSPRLTQYLVNQQQQQQSQTLMAQGHQQYNPPKLEQNVHMRPISSHPATIQNLGSFEQQSPRLNLNVPPNVPKEDYVYPPPPTAPSPRQEHTPSTRHENDAATRSAAHRNYPYATNNPVHKSPINHLEYNYTRGEPICDPVPPNDKSEQVKPNCLPERTPRLNSDQASASTQISIPKMPNVQPISPGYNELATERYKNLQQDGFGGRGIGSSTKLVANGVGRPRESRHEQLTVTSSKIIDKPQTPDMKGDMMASSATDGQQLRPLDIRPEIASQ